MKIDGSVMISINCILENNLPTTIVGNQWYITVKNANDTVGKLWVPNSNGRPVCLVDTPITDAKIASLENQINVLNDTKLSVVATDVTDFDNIVNTSLIKSSANIVHAPSIGQFVGLKIKWDDNFHMTLGTDIFGDFYARKNNDEWEKICTSKRTTNNYSPLNGVTSDGDIQVVKCCGVVTISWYGLRRPASTNTTAIVLEDKFRPIRDLVFQQAGVTVTADGLLRIEQDNLGYNTITYVAKGDA